MQSHNLHDINEVAAKKAMAKKSCDKDYRWGKQAWSHFGIHAAVIKMEHSGGSKADNCLPEIFTDIAFVIRKPELPRKRNQGLMLG